jgi:signal transduction histidine kinase
MEEKSLVEALREIPIFADLSEEQLSWFASHSEDVRYDAGAIISREGEPAEWLYVVLEGEIRAQRESAGPESPAYTFPAGGVTGLLPFSRMTQLPVVVRALLPTRGARLHKDQFTEMFEKIPQLLPRLVGVMADRIREVSRVDQQHDKLMALGKLSAGLAHELNNPASAARRAAEGLRELMGQLRENRARLDQRSLSCDQRRYLADLEQTTIVKLPSLSPLDSLTQSDREDETNTWLESHGVQEAWKLSTPLVEAGLGKPELEEIAKKFDDQALTEVLQRFTSAIAAEKLVHDIEESTGRISELVRAIKEYSYMDQNPEKEIDIHQGIDSTLTMLNFRLKKGVQVIREYDQTLAPLCAHGSELNQVWTNIIDNAIDAMDGKGELRIRTCKELDRALIEFIDNGHGIPPDIKDRIFEPFFTTKNVGDGTGLGLDTVYRIVRSHHGQIRVDSRPGQTRFQVWLPFYRKKEGAPA